MIRYSLLFIAALFVGCAQSPEESEKGNSESSAQHDEVNPNDITTGMLQQTVIHSEIECTGRVDAPPQNRASVHAPIEGIVYATDILPGETVAKNQVLAELRHPSIIRVQEDYLNALAQWEMAVAEYNRKQTLFHQEAISEKEYINAKAEMEKSVAAYQAAKAVLEYLGISPKMVESTGVQNRIEVRSPISGTVTASMINVGKYISADAMMFSITGTEHSHLELEVYARYMNLLREGQKIEARFDGGNTIYGDVFLVSRAIDPSSNLVHVHGHIDDEANAPAPGTYLRAVIFTESDTVYAVPKTAIVQTEEGQFVYTKTDEHFEQIEVQTGLAGDDYVEIINAADLRGKEIVFTGTYYVQYGVFEKAEGGHDH